MELRPACHPEKDIFLFKKTSFIKKIMANEYSIEIHRYLSAKIAEAEALIRNSTEDSAEPRGQLEELLAIRKYLSDNIDLKDFTYY